MDEKSETTEVALSKFMNKVKDWRAKSVIFQTLKLYFDLDSITNKSRSIDRISAQLRQIYTNTYYKLIADDELNLLVKQAAENEGFEVNEDSTEVLYSRILR